MEFILTSPDLPIPSECRAFDDAFKLKSGPFRVLWGKLKLVMDKEYLEHSVHLCMAFWSFHAQMLTQRAFFSLLINICMDQRANYDQSTSLL